MKKLLGFLLILFLGINVSGQQKTTPVISKITATWCTFCGSWGWDFFEDMKENYESGEDAIILGVHYSGTLNTSVSSWLASNLKSVGQPVFYINNEDQNVRSSDWQAKVAVVESKVQGFQNRTPVQNFWFNNAYVNEADEIVTNITFAPSEVVSDDHYFAVYIFENNVEAQQTSRGFAMHPNVLQDVIGNSNFGELAIRAGESSGTQNITKEYSEAINSKWNKDNVGLLAVLWRKVNGVYEFENSKAIFNIGLLSSDKNLIDEDLVSIHATSDQLSITVDSEETFDLHLINPIGQFVTKTKVQGQKTIDTSSLPIGVYSLFLSSKNEMLSKQVFIGR